MITITIHPYGVPLHVHFSDNVERLLAKYKSRQQCRKKSNAVTFYEDIDGFCIHIIFKKQPDASTIAHELVHVVNMIYQRVGITPDLDNDEPQAYLMSYLFNEVSYEAYK